MEDKFRYSIYITFSEQDNCYIATVPALPGCNAFGDTPEKALKEVQIAIELWIDLAREMGREIPKPVLYSSSISSFESPDSRI